MFEPLIASLLSHSNPSVRYLALTELGGVSPSDPEARRARSAMVRTSPARSILEAQFPAGYWMHPGLGISPHYRATLWQLLFLAQLGVGSVPAVDRAVAYVLEVNRDDSGAFRLRQGPRGRSLGLTGAILWALGRLGYRGDPRLTTSWDWVRSHVGDTTPPMPDRVWLMRAAALWGWEDLVARWVDVLVFDGLSPLTFPLTHQADGLAVLEAGYEAASALGGGRPPGEAAQARRRLMEMHRDGPDGGWPLERIPGKLWFDPGAPGRSNPWVTIRALRVLGAGETSPCRGSAFRGPL